MKLLVVTQKVDATDANLGFFVRWIEQLAKRADITVIANAVGAHRLPPSVTVHSLGKERNASRLARFIRYQKLLWRYLRQTDGVFFHMCPEYVLGAHTLPRLFRKKALLWYVHKQVSWRLRLAAFLVDRIFTASKESCRLPSTKIEIIGHGIDTELFSNQPGRREGKRMVTVGRISPVKDVQVLILGFLELKKRFPEATFFVVGEPITAEDRAYLEELRRIYLAVQFLGGVSHEELPRILADADVFIHASRTGSMDKAVLEALAAGLPVFTSSEAFTEAMGVRKFREGDPADLADKTSRAFSQGRLVTNTAGSAYVRGHHSLHRLVQKIISLYGNTNYE